VTDAINILKTLKQQKSLLYSICTLESSYITVFGLINCAHASFQTSDRS